MRTLLIAGGLSLLLAPGAVSAQPCTGDCNGNGVVSAGELTIMIARIINCSGAPTGPCGTSTAPDCANADANSNGTISAGELTRSIFNIINGCAPAATPTRPAAGTPTPTPTPGGPALGVRNFSVRKGGGGTSSLFTTALNGADASVAFVATAPMKLSAGPVGPDGIADISLMEDVLIAAPVVGNVTTACFKILAAGSSGKIDCDGGTPMDARVTVDSHGTGPDGPTVAETGLGAPAPPGSAFLMANFVAFFLEPGPTPTPGPGPAECFSASFEGRPLFSGVFTTANGSTLIQNAREDTPTGRNPDGTVTLAKTGQPFVCAQWTQENSNGTFVGPVVLNDVVFAGLVVGDTASVVQLDD